MTTPSSSKPRTPRTRQRPDAVADDQSPSHIDTARAAPEEEPRLPHERDESLGMANPKPDDRMRRAHKDLAQGRQDTDRGPVADRAYQKLKR